MIAIVAYPGRSLPHIDGEVMAVGLDSFDPGAAVIPPMFEIVTVGEDWPQYAEMLAELEAMEAAGDANPRIDTPYAAWEDED